MEAKPEIAAFDRGVGPVLRIVLPEEKAEYAGYVRANKFVAILQRQARQLKKIKPVR